MCECFRKANDALPDPPEPLGAIPWGRIRARIGVALVLMVAVYIYNEYIVGFPERTVLETNIESCL